MKTRKQSGFTLIELIVVIGIIALLVGIIGPSISKVRELGFKAKSTAAIQELASGAMQYKSEYNYYPLQTGWTTANPNYSGRASTYFGACMLGYIVNAGGITDPATLSGTLKHDRKPFIAESNDRFELTSTVSLPQYTPLDQWKKGDEMAVLYFPSNIGNNGAVIDSDTNNGNAVFNTSANSDYAPTLPTTNGNFKLEDNKFGSGNTRIFNSDSFLLIAPGIDRAYFTEDDIKNF